MKAGLKPQVTIGKLLRPRSANPGRTTELAVCAAWMFVLCGSATSAPPLAVAPAQAQAAAVPSTPHTTATRPAVLVYVTARLGEVATCGCAPERGGLGRQATYVAQLGKHADLGYVEAGDTFFHNWRVQPAEAPRLVERARRLTELLASQGLLATAVGECDLAVGLRVLEMLAKDARFPVLGANLITPEGRRPFPATAVVTIGGLHVGLVGLISDRLGVTTTHSDLVVEPPAKRLAQVLQSFSPRPDRIVVLAHMSPAEAEELARAVPGADLAVLGHGNGRLPVPRLVGSTLLVGSEPKGQELGEVDLIRLPSERQKSHRHVSLPMSLREDPAVAAKVKALAPPPARP
ncbi:MAG: hypothetical protein HY303_08795 [Candidatus Wallbacteria bacterium]|nr:hypothetical protein [Candidatus Wallbacteria bacterium]